MGEKQMNTIDLKKAEGSLQDEPSAKEIRNFAGMEVKEWKPYVPDGKHKKSSQPVFDGDDSAKKKPLPRKLGPVAIGKADDWKPYQPIINNAQQSLAVQRKKKKLDKSVFARKADSVKSDGHGNWEPYVASPEWHENKLPKKGKVLKASPVETEKVPSK